MSVIAPSKSREANRDELAEEATNESDLVDISNSNPQNSLDADQLVDLSLSSDEMKHTLLTLRELLVKQEHKYRENLQQLQEMTRNLERKLRSRQEEMRSSKEEEEEKCQENRRCQEIMTEFEKAIECLISENEENRVCFVDDKAKQEKELQDMKEHLTNTEKAYGDLQTKYQATKISIENISPVLRELQNTLGKYVAEIERLHEMFHEKKEEANSKCNRFNEEMASLKQNNQAEVSRLTALIKKSELRTNFLRVTLEQKTKEKNALVSLCDEILNSQTKEDSDIMNCDLSE